MPTKNVWASIPYNWTYLHINMNYLIIDVCNYMCVCTESAPTIPEAVPLRSSKCVAFRCKRSFEADTVLCSAATASRNSASCQWQRYRTIKSRKYSGSQLEGMWHHFTTLVVYSSSCMMCNYLHVHSFINSYTWCQTCSNHVHLTIDSLEASWHMLT